MLMSITLNKKKMKQSLFCKHGFQLYPIFSPLSFSLKAFRILYINFIHILTSSYLLTN